MTWAPVALQVVGAAFSAYQAFSNSSADKSAYKYQAAVDRNNAMVAQWQADDAARRGEQELIDAQRRRAAIAGQQRATLAGRGIDMSEGSALNILSDTDYMGQQDELTIKDNTAKQVWAAKVQGTSAQNDARLAEWRANRESPWLSGASTLLTSAPKVADAWYKYKKGG